jgi:hypothetical protein
MDWSHRDSIGGFSRFITLLDNDQHHLLQFRQLSLDFMLIAVDTVEPMLAETEEVIGQFKRRIMGDIETTDSKSKIDNLYL